MKTIQKPEQSIFIFKNLSKMCSDSYKITEAKTSYFLPLLLAWQDMCVTLGSPVMCVIFCDLNLFVSI